jgi:hypothetical protein
MKIWIPKNIKDVRIYLNDSLFKNSYFLMASAAVISVFGIIFG